MRLAGGLRYHWLRAQRLRPTPTISRPIAANDSSDSTVSENELFVRACIEHTGLDVLKHISTREAVCDLEQIRKALGNEKLTAIGYSYGTKVVASYAEQFPQSVRALVLDGVVDLSEDYFTQRINQEKGFQATFERFAAYCAREGVCFYRQIRKRLRRSFTNC